MATIAFDTHKFVKDLQASGMPAEQAEAFVRAQQEILAQALDSMLATRDDINRVERKQVEHDGRFTLLQWMLAFNLAFTLAIVWKVFS